MILGLDSALIVSSIAAYGGLNWFLMVACEYELDDPNIYVKNSNGRAHKVSFLYVHKVSCAYQWMTRPIIREYILALT